MVPIQYLDGRYFRHAIVAAADWVRHTREHINRINVFPVPDGDTGTNMALSLSATAAAVRAVDEPHLGEVSRLAAEASILGAKGNSGVIMSEPTPARASGASSIRAFETTTLWIE